MKGFKLNENGDIMLNTSGHIEMISGQDLILQNVKIVLGTNKGEWVLNRDEGITFSNILGKGKTEDAIKDEIQRGLIQVDRSFVLTNFELTHLEKRKYKVSFIAQNSASQELSGEVYYG